MARKKFVSLCTNALLLEKKLDLFEPSPYLFFSVHLDGLKEHHDKSVSQKGVFDRAVSAIKAAQGARASPSTSTPRIFDGHAAEDIATFLDFATELGVGVSMSPGYAYERAPDQEHFLNRTKTKELFRDVFALGKGKKLELHAFRPVPRLPRRQPGIPLHAVGHADAQHLRLAEALLSARRRLRQDLQGADGDHRLGHLRHRQVREVRRLHGALRLRADRGERGAEQSAEGAVGGAARRPHHGPDGAGDRLDNQRPAQYIFSAEVQKHLSEIRRTRRAAAAKAQQKASTAA